MTPLKTNLFIIAGLCFSLPSSSQTQTGQDINGEAAFDQSGFSVSMPDISTMAIGAPYNNGNSISAGHVRVFTLNGSTWLQKGQDLDGEAAGDFAGWSTSMPDANTVAIGAIYNDDNGANSGHVRVYSYTGGTWIQKGVDINGEFAGDNCGWSVSMPDSNTLAVGAPKNFGGFLSNGHVRIYTWNGTSWVQKGLDIDGEAGYDESGSSVSMPDANTIAIASRYNNNSTGHVRVFTFNGNSWTQKGLDIDGENNSDESGWSVSMPDMNSIAIGAIYNSGNGSSSGHVRVYTWNGNAWVQKGTDIDGEAAGDQSGFSVSMADANRVAIGARYNNGNGSGSGHVRIYSWNGNAWTQTGPDINGESTGDQSGWSVSMPDENTVGIGAIYNSGNGTSSGHVRVYNLLGVGVNEHSKATSISISPNPTQGFLKISFTDTQDEVTISLQSLDGKEIKSEIFYRVNTLPFKIEQPAGVYLLTIITNTASATVRIVKE